MELQKVVGDIIEEIKDVLHLSSSEIIGIDIGSSAVKIAEIKNMGKGKLKLLNYISVPLVDGCLIEDEIQKPEEITEAILEGISGIKTSVKSVCLGLYGPNCVARKLQLAGGDDEEIEDQVSWEAEQYLPFSIDESKIAFDVTGKNEGGGIEVVIAAVKEDVLYAFKDLVDSCGLRTKIVDLSILALANVFEISVGPQRLADNNSFIVIDFGAQKTIFLIYKGGAIVFSKEIVAGGSVITEEIQRRMGVNYTEAEDLKIMGDENGNLPEEVLEIVEEVLESVYSEIKKTLDFYITSTSDESFQACYLTGGGSRTPGLVEGLDSLLELDINILNPFDHISYNSRQFNNDEIDSIVYEGAVVLGLAMREYNK